MIYGDKSNWWAAYALWCSPCSATRTSGCSTVVAVFGWPRVATSPFDVPNRTATGYPVVKATTARSGHSAMMCWRH